MKDYWYKEDVCMAKALAIMRRKDTQDYTEREEGKQQVSWKHIIAE